ncbi:hypothetical protein PP761_gp24 [Stenotrophomonas phage Paxi]|uniref:Uncharacterized protein n=1 Tax=Stenotrophomonas phage Paxi TaxID=2859653 RepID=A0AAE8BHR4_9CAUD|nr:hypothetical protein PP761_gp24 [Stenotrophomonas phage Paxi]QYW01795.1 hypothetical protein CPT_Paxi_024 [Stenotrophomonas phage Paxi]
MDENIVWVHETSVVKYTTELIDPNSRPLPFTGTTTREIIGCIFTALKYPNVGFEVKGGGVDWDGENVAAGIHAVLELLGVEHQLNKTDQGKWFLKIMPIDAQFEIYRKKPFTYFQDQMKWAVYSRFNRKTPRTELDLPKFNPREKFLE